jgi:DNA-binding NarL/FixJ family response regulator
MRTMRVLIVDDYEPWRRFVWSELQKWRDVEIVGEVSDGLEAVRIAHELQPDLILLDIGLPTLNGIEAARQIRTFCPKSKILFVSQELAIDLVQEGLCEGASGYIAKADAGSELLIGADAVLRGERFVSTRFAISPYATRAS